MKKQTVSLEIVTRHLEKNQSKNDYEQACIKDSIKRHEIPVIVKKCYSTMHDECEEISAQFNLISTTGRFIVYHSLETDFVPTKHVTLNGQNRLLWAEKCKLEIEYRFLACSPSLPTLQEIPPLPTGAYLQACDFVKRKKVSDDEKVQFLSKALSCNNTPRMDSNKLSSSPPRHHFGFSGTISPRRNRSVTMNHNSLEPCQILKRTKTISSLFPAHGNIFVPDE